ncbi:helix-turn-helix domain-containing protein [Saccharospirillum mangrovi]|uniref:helix-turn-helix domain-containing protein n=1 Tax=Saccharospirillum mangrovi TaxID=2161747 RepID=UPI000D372227|nr:AraC family transcriptional regulator [Saccharospirillum mangrovi]
MRAFHEHIETPADASWRFFHRQLDALPFEWHFHPEYELTLTINSAGKRYVGDHLGSYQSGDLVLIGPNLPHSWQSLQRPDPAAPHTAFVLWFSQDWVQRLSAGFAEYRALPALLNRARQGLAFDAATSTALRPAIEALVEAPPRQRLAGLLGILDQLLSAQGQTLASPSFAAEGPPPSDQQQLSAVLEQIHQRFAEPLSLAQLAARAHTSPATLSRFFRRHMKQSVHHYLTQVRLGHACADLIGSEQPIALIAERNGFSNLANFNRLFRKYRGETPSELRRRFPQPSP